MGEGVFLLKKWKMGVFFVKKVDLSSTQGAICTVSVFFYFTFYLFGGCAPNTPPCLRACVIVRSSAPVTLVILLLINVFFGINNALAVCFAC